MIKSIFVVCAIFFGMGAHCAQEPGQKEGTMSRLFGKIARQKESVVSCLFRKRVRHNAQKRLDKIDLTEDDAAALQAADMSKIIVRFRAVRAIQHIYRNFWEEVIEKGGEKPVFYGSVPSGMSFSIAQGGKAHYYPQEWSRFLF